MTNPHGDPEVDPDPGHPDEAWQPQPVPVVRGRPDMWWAKGLVGLATAIVVALLGFPLGAAWSAFAPWLPGVVQSDGVYLVDVEGEQRAGEESWFILLSIGTGIVLALLVWFALRRFRGAAMVVALAVGGGVAGWLAWWYGHNIGRAHSVALARTAKVGTVIKFPVDLRIKQIGDIQYWHGWFPHVGGVLMYLAFAAVAMYMIMAGFSMDASLRPTGKRPVPVPHTEQFPAPVAPES